MMEDVTITHFLNYFVVLFAFIVISGYPLQASDQFNDNHKLLLRRFGVYPAPILDKFETPANEKQLHRHVRGQNCPCDDPRWCKPIQKKYDREVFIFSYKTSPQHWLNFDWNKVTTVVLVEFVSYDLICYAHKHGARVVPLGLFPVANLTNATQRSTWAKATVKFVQDNFMDGVNFDIEDPIAKNDTARVNGLTALVAETAAILRSKNPHAQVTYDVAWSPDFIDGRCYDIQSLSKVTDFLFVMSYDEQSQIHGRCIAKANSGFYKTIGGLKKFFDLGIKPDQLILGIPWYGYDYECLSVTKENVCYIHPVPFRGVNCSDAAGRQYGYGHILPEVDTSLTGRLWDNKTLSPYFNYKDKKTGKIHQVWYDDPYSLKLKYNFAVAAKLRGVGMWEADSLDYSDTALGIDQRVAMWAAIPDYGSKVHVMNRKGVSIRYDNRMSLSSNDKSMSSKDKL